MRFFKVTIAYSLLFPLFLLFSGCGPLFFYPQKQMYDNPVARQFSPEDIYFKTSDGLTLHGWFFQAADLEARATILVLHGNAENLSTHVNSVLWLIKEGFNLFIFDYRGYGKSQGSPSIKGVHLDAESALKALLSVPRVDKERIIVLGQSIGGAIAVYTVAHTPYKDRIAALVIDSAFSSYRLIAREKLAQFFITWPFQYPLSYLVSDAYSPIQWIREVSRVPVLIIHGDNDPVVPVHHGQMLYEAARDPKEFWEITVPGHVRSFADAGVRDKLVRYLTSHLQKM
ncbi:MAG: alpha/beta hydrolase [Nitrospirota bacterium]